MLKIERANLRDAEILTKVQTLTFDDDSRVHGLGNSGGPPEYNSVKWNRYIMKKSHYYKILKDNEIIGGIIIFFRGKKHCEVGRIYIHPKFHNQGIGTKAFEFLETTYPYITKWSLNTPSFAKKNQYFYEKLGYIRIGEQKITGDDNFLILYEKKSW
jgi:GNAT superfamily N-acetyltransferase